MATLAPGVRLHTPVYPGPIEDRQMISTLLGIILDTFEGLHYTDALDGESVHGLVFRASVGDHQVEGLDLLRFDEAGLIDEFTVMIRPLPALERLRDIVTEVLAEASD